MYIDSRAKWIYLDVPRTGSHSMGAMLTEHYGGALCRRHQWPDIWATFPRWFLFATVRNPFTRFLSIWRFASERRDELAEPWRKHMPAGTVEEMLVWLHAHEAAVSGNAMPWTRVAASQSVYLAKARPAPDLIIKLETVNEDIKRLPFYRPGVVFPWQNRTGTFPTEALPLSELAQDLIRDLYAEDFERFGYSTTRAPVSDDPAWPDSSPA